MNQDGSVFHLYFVGEYKWLSGRSIAADSRAYISGLAEQRREGVYQTMWYAVALRTMPHNRSKVAFAIVNDRMVRVAFNGHSILLERNDYHPDLSATSIEQLDTDHHFWEGSNFGNSIAQEFGMSLLMESAARAMFAASIGLGFNDIGIDDAPVNDIQTVPAKWQNLEGCQCGERECAQPFDADGKVMCQIHRRKLDSSARLASLKKMEKDRKEKRQVTVAVGEHYGKGEPDDDGGGGSSNPSGTPDLDFHKDGDGGAGAGSTGGGGQGSSGGDGTQSHPQQPPGGPGLQGDVLGYHFSGTILRGNTPATRDRDQLLVPVGNQNMVHRPIIPRSADEDPTTTESGVNGSKELADPSSKLPHVWSWPRQQFTE